LIAPVPVAPKHVVIIGGGIAGLATAWTVQRRAAAGGLPITCTVIEADTRWGGKILTRHHDDFIVEAGPDSFLSQKPAALALCRDLGLEDELTNTNPSAEKAFVFTKGRLRPLPEGLVTLAPGQLGPFLRSGIVSWRGAFRMGFDLVSPKRRVLADESVASFFRRHFGQEAFAHFIEPLMAGIYAGDAEQMSLVATFPRFVELEQHYGSIIRGMWAGNRARKAAAPAQERRTMFVTLRGGLGRLVETLVSRLEAAGVQMIVARRAIGLLEEGGKVHHGYEIRLEDGEAIRAHLVVLATPAYVAADLLSVISREAAALLAAIPYVSTATVALGYDTRDLPGTVRGYGFVVPRVEGRDLLAATWSSLKWPERAPAGSLSVRCYVGGMGREAIVKADDQTLLTRVRDDLAAIAGLRHAPRFTIVTRWERAMPQYHVGHLARMDRLFALTAQHHGLYLTGAAYRGIGIPDCIRDGVETGERVVHACEQAWG